MKRERKDSGEKPKRRAGPASGRSGKARPPQRMKAGSGRQSASTSNAGKDAAKKAAARKPAPPPSAARVPRTQAPPSVTVPGRARAEVSRSQKAAVPRSARPTTAPPKAAQKVAPAAPRPPRAAGTATPRPPARATDAKTALTDEERIESAKYLTRQQPPRVFEEERFIFPETYGRNRVRLLVKDPQWLFAHWDVDPGVFSGLRSELGERAAALARLTLKVTDPELGGSAVIHLPEDARSWYVRADRVRRAYRAELGLTLPSGEYRQLAVSNTVTTPQAAASPRRAKSTSRYVGPRRGVSGPGGADWSAEATAVAQPAGGRTAAAAGPGPWHPSLPEGRPSQPEAAHEGGEAGRKGGASDTYRR